VVKVGGTGQLCRAESGDEYRGSHPRRHCGGVRDARRSIHRSAGAVAALMAAELWEAAHGVWRLEAPLRPKDDLPRQVRHARRRKVITVTETPDAAIKMIAPPAEESGAG
jgi:hypothetical protein